MFTCFSLSCSFLYFSSLHAREITDITEDYDTYIYIKLFVEVLTHKKYIWFLLHISGLSKMIPRQVPVNEDCAYLHTYVGTCVSACKVCREQQYRCSC